MPLNMPESAQRSLGRLRECLPFNTSGRIPNMDDLDKRVVELVAEVLVDVNKDNIEMSSKIVEDLGAESLDIYDMIALLEDEFGLEITDEEVEKIQTVQDVADFIREHKKAS
jgi:acyl carrier protein